MKTLKFRIIEYSKHKGYTNFSSFSIQYKTGLLWMDYKIDNKIKIFESEKDCIKEIFEKSKFKSTELRLKEYPRLKFITLKHTLK
jgi:hypothetical protein